MRLPFFKPTRVESTPTQVAAAPLAATQRIPIPTLGRVVTPVATPATPAVSGPTVPIRLASIAAQIPSQIYSQGAPNGLTINLPVSLLLPQLASGRITVTLSELVKYFPTGSLRSPLPAYPEQQPVVLPLNEVISAIPADLLNTSSESEVSVNDPEFDKLPTLIDDSIVAEQRERSRLSMMETQPVQRIEKPVRVEPKLERKPVPSPIIVPPRVAGDMPEYIMISLKSLVNAMPESVFNCPRADLAIRLSNAQPVLLPAEPIVPQLRGGSVRLPASVVVSLLPHDVLAKSMPDFEGVMIPLPLAEIIPQFPPRIFTEHLREPAETMVVTDADIPDPFREKNAPEPVAELPAAADLDTAALDNENFALFTEKTTSPEPVIATAPVAPPAPVVVPEPVAEVVAPVAAPEPVTPPAETPTTSDEQRFLIDINRCSAEDLMMIPGVGRALAQRIIDFRTSRGRFASVEELRQVPGVGRKTFRALTGVQPRALNRLLGVSHDGELTLQEIVRLAGQLPGIQGCMLALSDGLFLTGQLPEHMDQITISVFAPQLFKKVGRYARELKVGQIRRFTIFTDTQPLSIFKAGDVYLIIVHEPKRYSKALLRRCERISQEIARLSSQRVTV